MSAPSSGINKLILNNFIVKNRNAVRKGKAQITNNLLKRSRAFRKSKADSDLKKNKNDRKADKLIEEIRILRKFYDDDVTKYALLNKKALLEVTNDANSTLEERALCRIATYKTVAPEIDKFRNQYPDWEQKVPHLLKTMGLQYRNKRLKKLDIQGRKEKFLEKEHHSTCVLQQLTDLEVDRRLLAKATSMMKATENKESDNTKSQNKSTGKKKDKFQNSSEDSPSKTKVSLIKAKKKDKSKLKKKSSTEHITENESTGTVIEKENHEDDQNEDQCIETSNSSPKSTKIKAEKKTPKKGSKQKPAMKSESLTPEKGIHKAGRAESVGEDEQEHSTEERAIKEELKTILSEDEEISEDGSSGCEDEEEQIGMGNFLKGESEESGDEDDERSGVEEESGDEEDGDSEAEIESYENASEEDDEDSDEEGSHEEDELESDESESVSSEISSQNYNMEIDQAVGESMSNSQNKSSKLNKEPKSVKLGNKFQRNKTSKKVEEEEGSDNEGSIDFDSEGSVIDENYVGEEVTSIWDDFKEKDKGKSRKKGSKRLLDTKDIFSGSEVCKTKGTVAVRRLKLTDQKSVDALLETNKAETDSESEEEDFFIREPVTKKRKKSMKNVDGKIAEEASNNDDVEEEEGESDDAEENFMDARERFIDKSFKKIWGKGMEETIKGSRGRRGMSVRGRGGGRGFEGNSRGGFERNRGRDFGGSRGRGFRKDNPNLMPLGNKMSFDQEPTTNDNTSESRFTSNSQYANNFKQFSNNTCYDSNNRGNNRDRFSRGGRGKIDRGRPGAQSGRFGNRNYNPNLSPVTGNRDDNSGFSNRGGAQNSLLHPSWLAKQKEKEMASSIHHFKGQVKKFDFDD